MCRWTAEQPMHRDLLVCQSPQSHDTRFAASIELGSFLDPCWSVPVESIWSSDVCTWLSGQISSLPCTAGLAHKVHEVCRTQSSAVLLHEAPLCCYFTSIKFEQLQSLQPQIPLRWVVNSDSFWNTANDIFLAQ